MNMMIKALVTLCVLFALGWGYQRMDSLSTQLQTAQESLQVVQATMATQKALDQSRQKLDQSVRDLNREISKTNDLTRRLYEKVDAMPLSTGIVDGLHKGCESIGVACLPK